MRNTQFYLPGKRAIARVKGTLKQAGQPVKVQTQGFISVMKIKHSV